MRGLLIKPHPLSSPGTIGDYAEELGVELVGHVASEDGPLPPVDDFHFVVAMGAPWSVYGREVEPWIQYVLQLFRDALKRQIPVLGVCFGAQAFAQALGGEVRKAAETELGWSTVLTHDPDVIPEGPWFMWHSDTFTLPPGARLEAWTDAGPQAYTLGRHLMVQFHPEVRPDLLEGWSRAETSDVFERLSLDRGAVEEETGRRAGEARERARALFDRFLHGVAAGG